MFWREPGASSGDGLKPTTTNKMESSLFYCKTSNTHSVSAIIKIFVTYAGKGVVAFFNFHVFYFLSWKFSNTQRIPVPRFHHLRLSTVLV